MFKLLISFISVASALGQSVQQGGCILAGKTVVQNFNINLFAGQWHQIERIPTAETGDCVTTRFTPTASNNTLTVAHRAVASGVARWNNGTLTRATNVTEARWNVTYPPATQTLPYLVLNTDYTGYALIYSCANITNNTYHAWAWKLSRTTSLSTAQASAINNTVLLYPELRSASWRATNHTTQACRVNGSYSLNASAVLVLVAMFVSWK